MKRFAMYFVFAFLVLSFASALSGPITVNGKDYYVVTSLDPTEDTGAEVCAKIGATCVGFTDSFGVACASQHPSASTETALSGDESVVYCDGAPQSGVCAGFINTCLSCPTCSVSTSCDSPIGNLYRELYVECAAPVSSCPVQMFARDTDQLLNEVNSLNSALATCPAALPSGVSFLTGSGGISLDILRNNGRTDSVGATIVSKRVTGFVKSPASCSQRIEITEDVLDNILSSRDRSAAFISAYANKQFTLRGCTVIRKVVNVFTQPLARFFVVRNAPPPPVPTPPNACGAEGEQCNNRACQNGLGCGSPRVFQNGRWQPSDYRCINANDFQNLCVGRGNTPPAWDCVLGSCSQ